MKKLGLLALALLPVSLLALPAPAAADMRLQLRFNDNAHVVTMAIPTSSCRPDHKTTTCTWGLFVNEPFAPGQPVVGMAIGASGVLSVAYPAFCGVLQADAVVLPPLRKIVGHRHLINTCACPSQGDHIALSSSARPTSPLGGTGPDELVLGLGLLALAVAIVWRKRSGPAPTRGHGVVPPELPGPPAGS